MAWQDPTARELATSIGCSVTAIIRTELNKIKTDSRIENDGRRVYTSFVDEGDPQRAAVYETLWPQ